MTDCSQRKVTIKKMKIAKGHEPCVVSLLVALFSPFCLKKMKIRLRFFFKKKAKGHEPCAVSLLVANACVSSLTSKGWDTPLVRERERERERERRDEAQSKQAVR